MKLLDNLKKEFRLTRILLRQIFDQVRLTILDIRISLSLLYLTFLEKKTCFAQVAGVDELNMSTLRLRLRLKENEINYEKLSTYNQA